jgi:hypothetical protein
MLADFHPLLNYHQGTVLYHLSTTYPRICIQHMEPYQKRQHQQGWGSTTSSRQVCHWRLPAHKQCHSHATATPLADTTKQTSICPDSDDAPHSVQPCWYTIYHIASPHRTSLRTRGHSPRFLVPHTRTTVYCLNLVDAVFFDRAPYAGCIF